MRKVIFGINLTLDGCCDHTKGEPDEEIHEYFAQQMREGGTLLYGRITYQLMVPFWPDIAKNQSGPTKDMNDFAAAFDAVREIVVVSRTLAEVGDGKTRIIRGNLKEEVLKLKEAPGKDILVGGVDIPSQLMELDLIDEYRFVIHPIVAGEGRRLFDRVSLQERLKLKLVESKVFTSGCVALHYVKR